MSILECPSPWNPQVPAFSETLTTFWAIEYGKRETKTREDERRLREDEILYFTFCARSAPLICAVATQHSFPLLPPVYFCAVTAQSPI